MMIYAVYFVGQRGQNVLVGNFLMKHDAIAFIKSSVSHKSFMVAEVDGYEHFNKIRKMIGATNG
jgi:hypothetical protein